MTRRLLEILVLALLLLPAGCGRKKPVLAEWELDITRPPEKWLEMEPVRLLRDYVRIDTRQERGEQEGAEFLKRLFDCDGIETEIVCPAPRRCSLLARLPGHRREGALLLLNHIDVAPVDRAKWSEAPPFDGAIQRGYLYGRGAYDMKSLAIAQALALRNLKRLGIVPGSDILFLAEADEETGHRWGVPWLLEHRPEWFAGVSAVLNEGGNIEVVLRDARFWGTETVQAGYATAELEAASREPLEELAAKWSKLDAPDVDIHPHVKIGFDMLANHLTSPLTDPLRHLDRVRRNPAELAILPDRYASFLVPRAFWAGPVFYPPDDFLSLVVVSTPPGVDPTPYLDGIRKEASRLGIRVSHDFSGGVTSASPYPTPLTELLRRVTEAHYPGVPFGPLPTFSAYTTSVYLRQKGYPTYGYSTIPMNITDAVRRHGANERVYLRDLIKGVALFEDVLEEFALAGIPPGDSESLSPLRSEK
ncbi:MAG TPA: M20/M25/M40 family metallo-hydrolase [Thermoanaerobaculia bacterium]|nr:M20/M25/M40 family metallo-hydrolase [Thermoanaerobaculia bacterium]